MLNSNVVSPIIYEKPKSRSIKQKEKFYEFSTLNQFRKNSKSSFNDNTKIFPYFWRGSGRKINSSWRMLKAPSIKKPERKLVFLKVMLCCVVNLAIFCDFEQKFFCEINFQWCLEFEMSEGRNRKFISYW